MNFFDKIKNFSNQISEVENTIFTNKQDFLEMYERNIQLEKEISERKQELDVTNQRMLSLHHILDMMNSARPLSSVFNSIVKMLQGDLGYLHSDIVKINEDADGKYLRIISRSSDYIAKKTDKILGQTLETVKLNYPKEGLLIEALEQKKIKQSTDLRKAIRQVFAELSENQISDMLSNPQTHSVMVVPLQTQGKDFGWLTIYSSRDIAEEAELDFVKTFSQQIELALTIADLFEMVKNQAVTDGLTGLFNRRYFEEIITTEVERAERMKQPFTVIALDLDHLKRINDTYGHAFGDIAIKTISDVLKKNARTIDVAARMGGEEFNILLPGVDSKGGLIAAERIRSAIESCKLDTIGQITASIGVATFFEHSTNVEELLELADQAMYLSKRNGRNQVQLAKSISEVSWQEVAMDAFMEILSKHQIPVSKDISNNLCKKLAKSDATKDNVTVKEMLYTVADTLAKTYNPDHKKGVTKSKIRLATKIAKLFDLPEEEVNKLRIATMLYDVGNLMIPKEVFQKSGPLTDEEKEEIKKHPVIAAREILKPIAEVQDIIPIIEHHHENWDGSGYPGKASGKDIPLSSQIILIVDAYFALIEPRSYRDAMSVQEAIDIIKNDANKKWNPILVDEFVHLIENGYK